MKDAVFVSHANPEDNGFTLWLCGKLTQAGYEVWCDLIKNVGGEPMWADIEYALRNRAGSFLFVLSRSSNHKLGPRRELEVARGMSDSTGIRDFVIPLRIDDLPHSEMNILLVGHTAVQFRDYTSGLSQVLSKLDQAGVPKKPQPAGDLTNLLRTPGTETVKKEERYTSNWLPITGLPACIYYHGLSDWTRWSRVRASVPFPGIRWRDYLVSFAPRGDYPESVPFTTALSEPTESAERSRLLTLLRACWHNHLFTKRLPYVTVEGAHPRRDLYFAGTFGGQGFVSLTLEDGTAIRRRLTNVRGGRVWHFAIELSPHSEPLPLYAVRPRVHFSENGRMVQSSAGMRKSLTKNWWNDDWRDRLLAALHLLSEEDGSIRLRANGCEDVVVAGKPLAFASPVSYWEPEEPPTLQPVSEEELDDVDR